MTDLLPLIARLIADSEFASVAGEHLLGNRDFLLALGAAAQAKGRHDEALALAEHVLQSDPRQAEALLLSVKALVARGTVDEALRRMVMLRDDGHIPRFAGELQDLLPAATAAVNAEVAAGRLGEALRLIDLFIALAPNHAPAAQHGLRIATALGNAEAMQKYKIDLVRMGAPTVEILQELGDAAQGRKDYDLELKLRLALHYHPGVAAWNSAYRLQNVNHILSRAFIAPMTDERLVMVREVLGALDQIPPLPPPASPDDRAAIFDRFYRLSMGSLNLDAVFGPPLPPIAWPPISYARADGTPLSLAALAEHARQSRTEVAFFTSASVPYFRRYAKVFVASMLGACDCPCLVIVCVSGGKGRLAELAAELAVDDPRLILAHDEMEAEPKGWQIHNPTTFDPAPLPLVYFASIGLLTLHSLLPALGVPIFNSGIDTVLQRGVRDLLEERRGADVLLNLNDSTPIMESRITNSLTLTFPTPNGMLFANFLSNYLGTALQRPVQPGFFDQLSLLMAQQHVTRNGTAARVEYFGEFDTNNLMFKQGHAATHRDFIKKFRFVNVFAGGDISETAVRPEDITEPA